MANGSLMIAVFLLPIAALMAAEPGQNVQQKQAGKHFSLRIEAEDFLGAAHYPDWHTQPGQGWYSMEQRYFSGYAAAICDAQSVGAEITHKLPAPLPPGQYKFFLHLLKMRDGGKNGVEITLGDQTWQVVWDASTYKIRDYAVDEKTVTLTRPADKFTIKSIIIERHNIGDVPAYPTPAIMLDRITITNDMALHVVQRGSRQDVGLRDEVRSDQPGAERPQIEIPKGNRIRNGSFEVGTTTTWFGFDGYAPQPADLVAGAAHGRSCLELPAATGQNRIPGVFSNIFYARNGETVPVSLSLRSSAPVKVRVSATNTQRKGVIVLTVDVTDKWRKFSANAALPADPSGKYFLAVEPVNLKGLAKIYLDAVSVGLPADAAYQPYAVHEAGLASEVIANIFHDKDKVPAVLTLANHDDKPWTADLDLILRDYRDNVVARKALKQTELAPGGARSEPFDIACGQWGIFSAVVRDLAAGEDIAELCYVAIPERTAPGPGIVGFYGAATDERTMAIFKALGTMWDGTLADTTTRWVWTKDFDTLSRRLEIPGKHGVNVMYNLEILRAQPRATNITYEGTLGDNRHPPVLADLEQNVREIAAACHDKVAIWNMQDELATFKCPLDAFPLYYKATADAIRRVDPKAKLLVSSDPDFQERIVETLGKSYLDYICDCAFSPGGGHRYRHEGFKALSDRYGLPTLFSGFGYGVRSFYRTRAKDIGYDAPIDHSPSVDKAVAAMIVNRFDFNGKLFILYSAIPSIFSPITFRTTNIYDTDGSVIPLPVAYAWIGQFVENATEARKLNLPDPDLSAYAFKRNGDSYLVFWVDPGLAYGNVRKGDYALDIALEGQTLSAFGNLYPSVHKDGRTMIAFAGQPIFINCDKITLDAVAQAAEKSVYTNRLKLRGFCLGDATGGTNFEVALTNRTGDPVNGPLHVSESRGLLADGIQVMRDIEALADGQTATISIPLRGGLATRRPLANGSIAVNLSDGRCGDTFGIWCMPALRATAPPILDGRLEDWKGIAPAFIHATTRSSGGYGQIQVRKGSQLIRDENTIGSATRALWDGDNLYLAVFVKDAQVNMPQKETDLGKGDHAVICIDADLKGDQFDPKMSADDFVIKLQVVGDSPRVVLVDSKGKETPLKAAFRHILSGMDSGYCFEVVCPWTELGVVPRVGTTIGFDTTIYCGDESLQVQIEAAWAGFDKDAMNPTGYGQLILR